MGHAMCEEARDEEFNIGDSLDGHERGLRLSALLEP